MKTLKDWVNNPRDMPLVIYGEQGAGRTAFLQNIVEGSPWAESFKMMDMAECAHFTNTLVDEGLHIFDDNPWEEIQEYVTKHVVQDYISIKHMHKEPYIKANETIWVILASKPEHLPTIPHYLEEI